MIYLNKVILYSISLSFWRKVKKKNKKYHQWSRTIQSFVFPVSSFFCLSFFSVCCCFHLMKLKKLFKNNRLSTEKKIVQFSTYCWSILLKYFSIIFYSIYIMVLNQIEWIFSAGTFSTTYFILFSWFHSFLLFWWILNSLKSFR